MTVIGAFMHEARTAGFHLSLDHGQLEAYAPERPPEDLVRRLQANRQGVVRVLCAEKLLMDWAAAADPAIGEFAELETNAELRTICHDFMNAVVTQLDSPVKELFRTTRTRLDELIKLPRQKGFAPASPPRAEQEYRKARRRLTRILGESPEVRPIPWSEFKRLEVARLTVFHQGEEDPALAVVRWWETSVRDLLLHPTRKEEPQ